MPKRIIRSKKRIMKNGKRNQRKYIKHRNLKTIKGGMFKTAKNLFSKTRAKGLSTGEKRSLIGEAFNEKQASINSTKVNKNKMNDYLTGIDVSKLTDTIERIAAAYRGPVPGKPTNFSTTIDVAREGIAAVKQLQQMFKDNVDKYNEQIVDIKGTPLITTELNKALEDAGSKTDILIAAAGDGGDEGEALEYISNNINSNESWYFALRALKNASREYLLNDEKKFSINNLFNNYLLRNKNLTMMDHGTKILEDNRDTLINELRSDTAVNQGLVAELVRPPEGQVGNPAFAMPESAAAAATAAPQRRILPERPPIFQRPPSTPIPPQTPEQLAAQAKTPVAGGISSTSWGGVGAPAPRLPAFPAPK